MKVSHSLPAVGGAGGDAVGEIVEGEESTPLLSSPPQPGVYF